MSAFGFNVDNVFGSARKGTKRKSKRKRDSMDNMMSEGLGIDTFSLADPNIDALGIGSDFGSQIGSKAGLSNGKKGGFLDIIGSQQVRVPSVVGRGGKRKGSGKSRGRKLRATPQLSTGARTQFGKVDSEFAGNVIGNIRGAKKRISAFREKRRKSKTVSTRDPPQLAFKQPALRGQNVPALEDKSVRSPLQ